MRFLSLAVMLMGLFACDASRAPAPPPVGQWRVAWLPVGGNGNESLRPGMSWRMRIDHQGPERTLEIVCETSRAGKLEASEVLLSTPLLETVEVDKGDYVTVEDVDAADSAHVNLRVTLIDLSRHMDGPENAYIQLHRWGRLDEGHAISPDAVVRVPALSAPGNHGGGPSWSLDKGSVWGVAEEVILTTYSRWSSDEGQASGVESRLLLRLR